MTSVADWVFEWLHSHDLPTGTDRHARVYAPLGTSPGGGTTREIRIGQTSGDAPLLLIETHSADRIAGTYAAQVHAACNRWNALNRLTRAWVIEHGPTLRVVIGAPLPVACVTETGVRRIGDAVLESTEHFWRWADLNAEW